MANIFFSYSHIDEELRNELEKHLTTLKRQGLISAWHDRRIDAGQEFDKKINQNLEEADIILFLVSSDFIASDYCYNKEMSRAMERHDAGEAVVIPVILRPCDWEELPFGKLLAATKDGKPIIKFSTVDDGFLEVVKAIKQVIRKSIVPSSGRLVVADETSSRSDTTTIRDTLPRSSNLRVKKEYTERDKDLFLTEAFEYIANYFEGSLVELTKRYPQIETDFRRVDSNRFSAVVYRNGNEINRCNIWLADKLSPFSDGILYSEGRYSGNSYNDSLSVDADGYQIYLKAMGFGRISTDEKLTLEGAAEHYWSKFIEHLQ